MKPLRLATAADKPPVQPDPESRFVEVSPALWAPLIRYCIAERVTMETAVAQFVRDGLESA